MFKLHYIMIAIIILLLFILVSDASGRYNSGYFWGNTFWLGSKMLCSEVSDHDNEVPFKLGFNIIKTYIALKAPLNYTVNMVLLD